MFGFCRFLMVLWGIPVGALVALSCFAILAQPDQNIWSSIAKPIACLCAMSFWFFPTSGLALVALVFKPTGEKMLEPKKENRKPPTILDHLYPGMVTSDPKDQAPVEISENPPRDKISPEEPPTQETEPVSSFARLRP